MKTVLSIFTKAVQDATMDTPADILFFGCNKACLEQEKKIIALSCFTKTKNND